MVIFIWMAVWAYHNMYNFTYFIVYKGVEYGNMSITFYLLKKIRILLYLLSNPHIMAKLVYFKR